MTGFEIGMGGSWSTYLALFGSAIAVVWFPVTFPRGDQDRAAADPKVIPAERNARADIDATEYERAPRLLGNQEIS